MYFRDGEEGKGRIGGKGTIADGDHCPAQNVPGPSSALGGEGVPGQGDTWPGAHAPLPAFPMDGYLSGWNRGTDLHVNQLGFPSGFNKNIDDIPVCGHS